MKIMIAGGGNMGRTYADSFTANQTVSKADLYILEHYQEKVAQFVDAGYHNTYCEGGNWVSEMDLIVLAVKPQDAEGLYPILARYIKPEQMVLTIMAGVRIEKLRAALPTTKILRAMPNLPAQIGMGMTGFTADKSVTLAELFEVHNLLNTTGRSQYFEDENLLDAVTAISGSGPAYVFYFMQAMISQAEAMGFSKPQSELLVAQTFMGAIHLLKGNNLSCEQWIQRVASKGGTTEAALKSFDQQEIAEHIGIGLNAALDRAVELGR
jgi:pyrroline-5-carboxylate reductase